MNSGPVYLPRIRIKRDGEAQSTWRFSGKSMGLSLLLLLLVSLIGSFYLSQASHTATAGLEVVRLAEQRERLRQDNAELRTQIARMQAASSIKERAEALGFVASERTEYLVVDRPAGEPTQRETLDHAPGGERTLSKSDSGSSGLARWFDRLMAQLDSWMNTQP